MTVLAITHNLCFVQGGGSVAEWFVRWTTELATRDRTRVAAGLPTGYSVLGGNLTEYCYQKYQPDCIIGEVMTHTVGTTGSKLFHPYQVGTFVDYPR